MIGKVLLVSPQPGLMSSIQTGMDHCVYQFTSLEAIRELPPDLDLILVDIDSNSDEPSIHLELDPDTTVPVVALTHGEPRLTLTDYYDWDGTLHAPFSKREFQTTRSIVKNIRNIKVLSKRAKSEQACAASLGRLTSCIVHEINNHIQAIQGAVTLASEVTAPRSAGVEYLDLALNECQRIAALTHCIRQLYKPGLSNDERIDLREIVLTVIHLLSRQCQHEKISLYFENPNTPIIIHTNRSTLCAVLIGCILDLLTPMKLSGLSEIKIHLSQAENHNLISLIIPEPGASMSTNRPSVPDLSYYKNVLKNNNMDIDMQNWADSRRIDIHIPFADEVEL